MPKLSKRLETILGMLESCGGVLDVGCDHGYTAIEAVRRGRALRAAAADVARGPLSAAEAHIRAAGLAGQIEICLSDGLRGLVPLPDFLTQGMPEDACGAHGTVCGLSMILSGIGGSLMCDILSGLPTNGAKDRPEADTEERVRALLAGMQQLLLSPQSEPALVRHLLLDEFGFAIAQEKMVCDEGKYYVILDVRPACKAEPYVDEAFYSYGAALIAHPDETFLSYLDDQERKLTLAFEKACAAAGIPGGQMSEGRSEAAGALMRDVQAANPDTVNDPDRIRHIKQAGRAGMQAAQLGKRLRELRLVRGKALENLHVPDSTGCKKSGCKKSDSFPERLTDKPAYNEGSEGLDSIEVLRTEE